MAEKVKGKMYVCLLGYEQRRVSQTLCFFIWKDKYYSPPSLIYTGDLTIYIYKCIGSVSKFSISVV